MRVLFVHQNYPAQFAQTARWLVANLGWTCTVMSEVQSGWDAGVRCLHYDVAGGATEYSHYCARSFENLIWKAHGIYEACRRDLPESPDLIVGHSGMTSTLFLRNLYSCPFINYFEYYYRTKNSDIDFRPEFPATDMDRLRAQARNSALLLDLENCDAGYCATQWQRSLFPEIFQPKLQVIFDGVDTALWHRTEDPPCVEIPIPERTRIVTYVSRGLEYMRGFDVFMEVARRIYESYPDVLFLVVGSDGMFYGGDERFIQTATFKDHVLQKAHYDLSKFRFMGHIQPEELARVLSVSDLHIYLTVPFVLSWSLFNAMACGCVVLGSDTPPVRELIQHERNGLLAGFYDVESLAAIALSVLRNPQEYRRLGHAAVRTIQEKYALDHCALRFAEMCLRTRARVG
jgi:glycosyltransferase involved in cell wall biosynthesis